MQHVLTSIRRALRARRALLLITAAIVITMVACRGGGSNPSPGDQSIPIIKPTTSSSQCINGIQPEGAPQFEEIDISRFEPLMEGLRYYEITPGTGESARFEDAASVEYTGWLENGCMFDTSHVNEGPTTFPLVNVIPGWQRSLITMKEGATWVIEVAPDLGYGEIGFQPRIGPDATLIFHLEFINKITIAEAQATVEAERAIATAEAEEFIGTATAEAEETVAAGGGTETIGADELAETATAEVGATPGS